MTFISLFLSLLITLNPSSIFSCDGDKLTAVIRNNLNGDFALTNDLENIDKGAFVVLNWRDINLMLPVSFKVGDISFTDKKWLWSYQDEKNGLRMDKPRFAKLLSDGEIQEYTCDAVKEERVS
ncbi:hypothetical protein [Prochlorococcus marinus]|uniref:C-type lysozyme inhibitor domain-containing protein n=1 Tax=Prochlorococcus marinus XMU1408 TaxID=2213228 RepID=A0A318QZ35_PROMR|nr:hypothetical protein [Prochlorococcus marinus]MBW3042550.1 hypothetical protein [Prochlorococcus marinus str. XMU1408]PYE01274.1 hypothetical protein DNJ73_07635 [Prochlorococcus marinus XMU1408]